MINQTLFVLATSFALGTLGTAGHGGQPQQRERVIVDQLRSDDAATQRGALEALGDSAAWSEEIKGALVTALRSEAERNRRRYHQARQSQPVEPLADPELVARLAAAVAEIDDTRAIPVMADALGPGLPLIKALARFGTRAVPDVARVAMSAESTHYAVNDSLIVLRMIAERAAPDGGLPAAEATLAKQVASHHLTSRPRFVGTLWWAIDLAVTLNDPALRANVEAFARDPQLAVAMGASDPDQVLQTQQRAAARLAGVPPQPRP
ncbi:MAG: hypothetical protein IT178_10965 [Acidobacteria bacterium]|nr:hypothetical protein [Acidobacteriota bacterium]